MGNHSKCFKCGELDEFCACIPASTAASEQPKKSATCSMLDIIRTMVFTVDQFAASSSPNDPPPWALNSPVVLAARRLCYEYGYETGDLIPAPAASEQQASVSKADDWRVGEFWSSANPGKKVLMLARGIDIENFGRHKDFIRWVGSSSAALSGRATIPSEADERAPSDDWIMDEYKRIVAYPERLSSGDYATAIKLVRAALTHRATTATPGLLAEILSLAEQGMCHGLTADDFCSEIVAKIKALAATPDIATTAADQQGDTARDAARFEVCKELSHGLSDEHGEFVVVQLPRPEGVFRCTADVFVAAIDQERAAMAAPATSKEKP